MASSCGVFLLPFVRKGIYEMKKIGIPETDLHLSPVGLGTVDAGVKWSESEAERIYEAFLDMGGNLMDTARVYSDWIPGEIGRSERVMGDWLKKSGKRHQVIISTKGGHPEMLGEATNMHQNRLNRSDMEKDVELSLKALKTDYIDLYFYHRDCEALPVEELVETMESFVKAGKIRYYGCSNWSAKRMAKADAYAAKMGYRGFVANQVLYNVGYAYMNPMEDDTLAGADAEMRDYHKNNPKNLLMPYTGNCGGFFQLLEIKGEEAVKKSPYYTEQNLKVAAHLKELKEKYQITMTQAVLGFFTQQDFSCLPLFAASKTERLLEALNTFEIPFEKEDYRW